MLKLKKRRLKVRDLVKEGDNERRGVVGVMVMVRWYGSGLIYMVVVDMVHGKQKQYVYSTCSNSYCIS